MAERSTNNNWGGLGLALIALITALGGIGGFVALYNVYQNANACSISGTVYDNGNNNRPVADAFIDYKESHNLFTRLATTAPDGHFDADCSNVPSNYPFRELRVGVSLYISSQNGNCINFEHTKAYMEKGREQKNVNIYVNLKSDYNRCLNNSEIVD